MNVNRYLRLLRVHNVRWLVIIQFLTQITFYSTVIVAYQTGRGLNYTEMFWLESVLSGAILLLEVPTGLLGDRLGHRRLVRLGQGLMFASYVLFAIARGFWPFALSSLLFGAGLACISGSDSTILYQSLPDRQRAELGGSAFALMSAAGSAGLFCGLVTGSWLGAVGPVVPGAANIAPMALAFAASFCLRPATADAFSDTPPAAATDQRRLLVQSAPV